MFALFATIRFHVYFHFFGFSLRLCLHLLPLFDLSLCIPHTNANTSFLPIDDLFVFINVRYPLNRLICAFSVSCYVIYVVAAADAAAAAAFSASFPSLAQLTQNESICRSLPFHFISIKFNLISCKCTCTVVSQHFTFTFF